MFFLEKRENTLSLPRGRKKKGERTQRANHRFENGNWGVYT